MGTAIDGQMWSYRSWLNWYRANLGNWSRLVWTLAYLNLTPAMIAQMILSQRARSWGKSKL